ncbi:signal transduction histidine kinase [Nitzschia inconspicua]|uniref:guanylate cyclase n=1 Tax=Nitzschia inconspicua TaxID=303405 RepID=A0A9K3KYZ4_9STRA|nr:signal transduction histidine kinase [Nitzschia inconspicua]
MPGDVVKEVFPYHIVLDDDFQILQVGNSMSLLIDSCSLIGQCVSDIFQITGPIPSFGKWEWSMLDKMKNSTVFFESIVCNYSKKKAKIKGTIIELSKEPHQVMFAMFPNVKNLAELEDMNLSMVDLPLHSCQREAVLLGEHSKSEVKLTNHLDHLHRDLINSMEKQIEERTTELASANQELEDANNQLARQSARQLEHFACMSHEIRTPLNCIVGMSSLLLEDSEETEMDPMHAESIKMIHTSGELLKAVVDDVLDYAKLESGAFLVDIKPTKLQDTLDSVVHSISQKVQEKNIRLRTHYAPTLPELLETDSRRLQQVLFNLLGNAGKFSKNDSVVDLSVSVVHLNDIDEQYNGVSLDIIRFSVKDYGKGIDSKDFEKIFKPFSQASKETQNVYGGTGLGLSITSKLVNRLGGTISVDSELDRYAEFTVDLPMKKDHLVDVQCVSKRLENIIIFLVEPELDFDIPVSQYPIKSESHPLSPEVIKIYNLNVIKCNRLDQAFERLASSKIVSSDHIAFLVHENLYQEDTDTNLSALLGTVGYTVMTHGPNYLVESTKNRHFKSLSRIFPVSLLISIARNVEAHKSEIFAAHSRNYSQGTHQSLEVRATLRGSASADGLATPVAEAKRVPRKHNVKVLYAEDNLVNQKVLSRVLNRAGITDITIVDDGQKAVDLSGTTKFDCIFMDMQMPIMDGMEATRIIMERDPSSKIIFVTAHALDEFKSRADAVGATSFISKPFRLNDIEKALEKTGICLTSPDSPSSLDALDEETNKATVKALVSANPTSKPSFAALSQKQDMEVKPLFTLKSSKDETNSIVQNVNQMHQTTSTGKQSFPMSDTGMKHFSGLVKDDTVVQVSLTDSTMIPPPLAPSVTSKSPKLGVTKSSSFKGNKEPIPSRNLKVLYAEDNIINQKVLTRVLNRAGITDITIVDNGKTAVDTAKNFQFDCIFMDMQMPVMDGMEATKLITTRDPESKIVFVTAHAMEEYKKQAEAHGARGFLSKPVQVADIEGVLVNLGL